MIRMHLVQLRLTRPAGPAPREVDAHLIHDVLWALAPPGAGIEHIRARAGPDGIDLTFFLRHDIPDPDRYARTLLATLARTSPALSAWSISTAR